MNEVKVWHESGKLRQEIQAGRHRLVADEPLEKGGEDQGPQPFEYLAASLATCTAITLRMYTQHKAWPLENAEVSVNLETSEGLTKFSRSIGLVGALSEEQRVRLLEVANHCPVHKILSGKIEIQTSLRK